MYRRWGSAINSRMILIRRDCGTLDRILSHKAQLGGPDAPSTLRRPSRPLCCRTAVEMPPEQRQIAGLRDRVLWNRWSIVGIRQTLGLVREQRAELDLAEAGEREVEAEHGQLTELKPQKFCIPFRPLSGAICEAQRLLSVHR